MRQVAERIGLKIIDVFSESKSAKKRGRPVFNEMIKRIKKGEANGILCWKLNRLARNPFDAGEITGLLQENIISHIQTYANGFLPSDNVMLMMIEFGIATQFSKDLSKVIQRGMRRKAARGWFPLAQVPLGYIHNPDRLEQGIEIIPDFDRFNIMKQLWEMLITGAFSLTEIREKAKTLGLTNTRGGFPSYSSFQRMFSNTFYMGIFYWKDENRVALKREGKHEIMVSEFDFLKVQENLNNRSNNNRPRGYKYKYNGLLHCGECNGHISAMRKRRAICTKCKSKFSILHQDNCNKCNTSLTDMKNPSILDITYYYCTKNKKKSCSQGYVNEKIIDQEIISKLKEIEIDKDFYEFAKKKVSITADNGIDQVSILLSLKKKIEKIKIKNTNLIDMRSDGELSSHDFISAKQKNDEELGKLVLETSRREKASEIWKKEANAYLDVMFNAVDKFNNGDYFSKRAIIMTFALNPVLFNRKLYFSTKKPLEAISLSKNEIVQ